MLKATHVILRPSAAENVMLREFRKEAARCWNETVRIAKEYYHLNNRKWISANNLQKALKGQFQLHSQTVQALADKYVENRSTIATLRREGNKKARYPYREKRFLTIPFKQMALRYGPLGELVISISAGIRFNTGYVPPSPIHTAEILYRKGRYVLSVILDHEETESRQPALCAGADLGEIHPVAVCNEDGKALVVSGRAIRSVKRYRNKALGKLSRQIKKCTKGSRKWKRYIRAKRHLRAWSEDHLRDLFHKASRKAINWCIANNVSELVIGDPKGVEQNTRQERRLGRNSRQKVSQMEYGRMKQYLSYKAKESGISACFVNERGTSKECPVCRKENRPAGRIYRCSCGYVGHRDAKASFLMIRKIHPDINTPNVFYVQFSQVEPKYRKRIFPACVDGAGVALCSSA